MPFFQYLDEHSDITDITFYNRRRFAPLDKFSEHIMRGPSPLTVPERELIAAFVSGLNECAYCHGTHRAVAENFGIGETVLTELLDDVDTADVDAKLRPLLRYVKKLTLTPSRLVERDARLVYEAGWGEDALHDAVCITGLFSFFNRLLDGHGIRGNDRLHQLGGEHLTKNGYGVPWFIRFIRGYIRKSKVKQLTQDTRLEAVEEVAQT